MVANPYEWVPNSNLKVHVAAADVIRRNPDCLGEALKNLEHWMTMDAKACRFSRRWKKLLREAISSSEGLDKLLFLLAEDSEEANQMKSYSPLACILDCETIDKVYESIATPALG